MSLFSLNNYVNINEYVEESVKMEKFSKPELNGRLSGSKFKEVIKIEESESNDHFEYQLPIEEIISRSNEKMGNTNQLLDTFDGISKLNEDIVYVEEKMEAQKSFIKKEDLDSLKEEMSSLYESLNEKYSDFEYLKQTYELDTTIIDESLIEMNLKEYVSLEQIKENLNDLGMVVSNEKAKHVGMVENMIIFTIEDIKDQYSDFLNY